MGSNRIRFEDDPGPSGSTGGAYGKRSGGQHLKDESEKAAERREKLRFGKKNPGNSESVENRSRNARMKKGSNSEKIHNPDGQKKAFHDPDNRGKTSPGTGRQGGNSSGPGKRGKAAAAPGRRGTNALRTAEHVVADAATDIIRSQVNNPEDDDDNSGTEVAEKAAEIGKDTGRFIGYAAYRKKRKKKEMSEGNGGGNGKNQPVHTNSVHSGMASGSIGKTERSSAGTSEAVTGKTGRNSSGTPEAVTGKTGRSSAGTPEAVARKTVNYGAAHKQTERSKSDCSKSDYRSDRLKKKSRLSFSPGSANPGSDVPSSGSSGHSLQKRAIRNDYAKATYGSGTASSLAENAVGRTGASAGKNAGGKAAGGISENIITETWKKVTGAGASFFQNVNLVSVSESGILKTFLVLLLVLCLVVTLLQSCAAVMTGTLTGMTSAAWPAENEEICEAEAYYVKLECELQKTINSTEASHPGSESYHYSIGEIGHDPSVLISYLCAKYGAFKADDVKAEIDILFAAQYKLKTETKQETVTADENDEESGDEAGAETPDTATTKTVNVTYVTLTSTSLDSVISGLLTSDEQAVFDVYQMIHGGRIMFGSPVEYDWHSNVLGSYGYRYDTGSNRVTEADDMVLSLPSGTDVLSVMNGTVKRIASGDVTLADAEGNEVTLSGISGINVTAGQTVASGDRLGTVGSGQPLTVSYKADGTVLNPYFFLDTGTGEITAPAIASDKASALIAEAEKYLGTPYVWGGYKPGGFDCSGYVSYCLTNSGVLRTGHLTANGLLARCTRITRSELQPGDLVFFQGTYNTKGASHVGIVRPARTIVEVEKGGLN